MLKRNSKFGAFWHGARLPALDAACLQSFASAGHEVSLYSYGDVLNVPSKIRLRDAAEIVPQDYINKFIANGKPSLCHFSDYFRYLLFSRQNLIWIDTDMLLIDAQYEFPEGILLARENDSSINNAIMRLESDDPNLVTLINRTEKMKDRNMRWGATGPLLLTDVIGKKNFFEVSANPEVFFPIPHHNFWLPLLPSHREKCEALTRQSATLHLWNNIVEHSGYWKEVFPPVGSFLATKLSEIGAKEFFVETYPENVLSQMIENWIKRQDGSDLGIKQVVKRIFPSVLRTYAHYWPPQSVPYVPPGDTIS